MLGGCHPGFCWNRVRVLEQGAIRYAHSRSSHPGFGQNRVRVLEQGAIKSMHVRGFPSWVWSKQGTSVGQKRGCNGDGRRSNSWFFHGWENIYLREEKIIKAKILDEFLSFVVVLSMNVDKSSFERRGRQECHQSQHHERDSFHAIADQGILGNDSPTEDCRHGANIRRSCNQEGTLLDTCQGFFVFCFLGGQFCLANNLQEDSAKFGYKLNVKVIFWTSFCIFGYPYLNHV